MSGEFKVLFEKPISNDLVCSLNLLEINPRKADEQDKLYLLCKGGLGKNVMKEFHQHKQTVNRFLIGAITSSQPVLESIRRELRRVSPDTRVELTEIETILRDEVLKREVIDGDNAIKASQLLKKAANRQLRKLKAGNGANTHQVTVDTMDIPLAEVADDISTA